MKLTHRFIAYAPPLAIVAFLAFVRPELVKEMTWPQVLFLAAILGGFATVAEHFFRASD